MLKTAYKKDISCCGLTQWAETPGDLKQQQAAIYEVSVGIMGRGIQTLGMCVVKEGQVSESFWSQPQTERLLSAYLGGRSGIALAQS